MHAFIIQGLVVSGSPMHSEAKQTKTLEFGAEKGLLQAMQGDRWLFPPSPQSPNKMVKHLKSQVWGGGGGWWLLGE